MKITIDFETRSKIDLKKCGPWVYAEDESTEVFCVAVKINSNPTLLWVNPKFRLPDYQGDLFDISQEFKRFVASNAIFEAHNAEFERAIWLNKMVPDFDCPDIPIEFWECSAAKCAALALPRSLDGACSALGLPFQKDMEGHRVMLRLCKPKKRSKKDPNIWDEDPEKLTVLFDYCKSDVDAEHGLAQATEDLPPRERRLWALDRKINERGIHVDVPSIKAIMRMVTNEKTRLNERCIEITGYSGTQNLKVMTWLNSNFNLGLENMKKSTVIEALATNIDPIAREVLELRQQSSKASTAKYTAMLNGKSANNRVKGTTMYHGASTGRWSGKRIQPHNMVRNGYKDFNNALDFVNNNQVGILECFYDSPMTVASKLTRNVICAEPGNTLICADYSSIESRFLAWLAGAKWKLDAFRSGKDLYKVAACATYKILYDLVTDAQRQVGKVQELALGYQGGWRAFMAMAAGYGVEVPGDIILTDNDHEKNKKDKLSDEDLLFKKWAQPIVYAWRDANPEIVDLWNAYEYSAIEALETGKVIRHRNIKFGLHKGYLKLALPSGRLLSYYEPRLKSVKTPWGDYKKAVTFMGMDTRQGSPTYNKWTRLSTYGGKICENVTSASARDLMAEAMPVIEDAGFPIIFHVHDEVIAEVPSHKGDITKFEKAMSHLPKWAEGLPVAAEGWVGRRYRK